MGVDEYYTQYKKLFDALGDIVRESERRVLLSETDRLFSENVNFFVKSYMINMCSYLEAYIQDLIFWRYDLLNNRLQEAGIPHNFLYWQIIKDIKEKDLKYRDANFPLNKKILAEKISANPYKTIKVFQLLGIDLIKFSQIQSNKDIINSVVMKRNNVVHHNDKAMDISFSDLLNYISVFLDYMQGLKMAVLNSS